MQNAVFLVLITLISVGLVIHTFVIVRVLKKMDMALLLVG
jgi:hypothetical protein